MKRNRHTQAIPAQVLQQVQTKLGEVSALLAPYVIALTPEERHDLPKMGSKSLAFVEKSRELAAQNPNLCPPYLDMQAFDADFADAHGLWAVQNIVRQLDEAISDTTMEAGSEAYQASLVFYNSVKVAAAQDIPGAKAVYEELRSRFPHGKRSSSSQLSEPNKSFE